MANTLTFNPPATGGKFLVLRMRGQEQLNRLSEYIIECVGDVVPLTSKPLPVLLPMLMGAKAELVMEENDEKRYFSGYIVRADHGERLGRYERWAFTLRPWLWFATRTRNSKVFQKKSVKEIVTDVLQPYSTDSKWELASASDYPKLDYCVQYDESDFDFVSRLLERAGINYFFKYSSGKHELVFVDANSKFVSKENSDPVKWENALRPDGNVCDWRSSEEVRIAKAVVKDHDYLTTATVIKEEKKLPIFPPVLKLGDSEVFEFPADVVQNSQLPDAQTTSSTAATQRAKVLFESLMSMQKAAVARTNVRDIAVGATFTLTDHSSGPTGADGNWIVVGANFRAEYGQHASVKDLSKEQKERDGFIAQIWCTKADSSNVRPEALTPKPTMRGPQTAIVVGPSGEEINTDKHGRVKIQFPWDRLGANNENSSCWVRVASPWASKQFGVISIPRVGDEVLVNFIDGDPDKPLVIGSLYNATNMPAWALPDNKTMSGIKSRTTKSGTFDNANELRFEDKKDNEYVWLQAEKDFYRHVKKKSFEWIGEDESVKILKNRKEVVGETWSVDVTEDVMHNYGADYHLTVAGDIFTKGDATWQIKLAKDLNVDIGGDFGYAVTGKTAIKGTSDLLLSSSGEVHIKGTAKIAGEAAQISLKATGGIVLDCPAGVTLKCGGSLVALTPAGVDIVGSIVKINSGGGGGSASAATQAAPGKPAEAKKLEDITSTKKADYDKLFEERYKPPA